MFVKLLHVFCVIIGVMADADLVPYTLGGTTIMVDREALKHSSPLLSHLVHGMPNRRVTVDPAENSSGGNGEHKQPFSSQSFTHVSQNMPQESTLNSFNNNPAENIPSGNGEHKQPFSSQSFTHQSQNIPQESTLNSFNSHPSYIGNLNHNDFKVTNDGQVAISVLPDGHQVIPYQNPKPINHNEEKLPSPPKVSQQSLYYSVDNPNIGHVSQRIHNIVSSLNEETEVFKENDRAPGSIIPPIPDSVVFVNSAQDTQYPVQTETDQSDSLEGNLEVKPTVEEKNQFSEISHTQGLDTETQKDNSDSVTSLWPDIATESYSEEETESYQTESGYEVTEFNIVNEPEPQDFTEVSESVTQDDQSKNIATEIPGIFDFNGKVVDVTTLLDPNDENPTTEQSDMDLATESSTEDQTSIPIEDILLQNEKILDLMAEEQEIIHQKEQEDQVALHQAISDLSELFLEPQESESEDVQKVDEVSQTDIQLDSGNYDNQEEDKGETYQSETVDEALHSDDSNDDGNINLEESQGNEKYDQEDELEARIPTFVNPISNHDSSVLNDFPPTRQEPEKVTGTLNPDTFHYSPSRLRPYPITQDEAAGIYVNNVKVFKGGSGGGGHPSGYTTRHDPPGPESGLLEWYEEEPINIFDPLSADQNVEAVIRNPNNRPPPPPPTSDNEINVGRPSIPGHVRIPANNDSEGMAISFPGESDNNGDDEIFNVTSPALMAGAVFHSADPELLQKSTCRCGLRFGTKIVGGDPTTIEQFPWMAGLTSKSDNFTYCGGSLLNDQYVLTAAHCVFGQYPEDIYIRFGETTRDIEKSVNIDVEKIIIHRGYKADIVYVHDIALIKLARPLPAFTDSIFPVCLAAGKDKFSGKKAIVSGWGRNSFGGDVSQGLREATVNVLSTKKCRKDSYYAKQEVHKKIVCALGSGIDACQGDSGGPLVLLDKDQYKQIGLVSWGIGCAQEKYPGIYTRISAYSKWISSNMKGAKGCQKVKVNKNKNNKKNNKNNKRKKNRPNLPSLFGNKNKNKRKGQKRNSVSDETINNEQEENDNSNAEMDERNPQNNKHRNNENNEKSNNKKNKRKKNKNEKEGDSGNDNRKRNKNRNRDENDEDTENNKQKRRKNQNRNNNKDRNNSRGENPNEPEEDLDLNWNNLQEALKGIGEIIEKESIQNTPTIPDVPAE